MSGTTLIFAGLGLVIVGLAIAGGGRNETARVGNTAVSVFGSVTQTFRSVGMAISGEQQRTTRDWVGWGLSGAGLVVGLIGLLAS